MLHNKSFFFFVLSLTFVSCQKQPKSLISQWDGPVVTGNFERKLAALEGPKCVKDLYSVETVKSQIQEFESGFAGMPPVTGKWRHLDLSQIPVPQANFLKKYGLVLGDRKNPNAIDYSGCMDVPCIFNRIYGRENHPGGYVHYLWYLKFGSLLAADNMVPRQNSINPGEYQWVIPEEKKVDPGDFSQYPYKKHDLSKFLFNEKELYGFWRLTLMLKAPHVRTRHLEEIQRIPPGEYQEKGKPEHCGQASTAGYINLSDGCLWFSGFDSGYFYTAVTHELSHHVDFAWGTERRLQYYSRTQEYLDIAEIDRVEYLDDAKVTQVKYVGRKDAKYVNEYAKTSPAETFAEMAAYFRHDGDKTKNSSSENHFNFIRDKIYFGRTFDSPSLSDFWISKFKPEIAKNIMQVLITCQQSSSLTLSGPVLRLPVEMANGLNPAFRSCLELKLPELTQLIDGMVLASEPEACEQTRPIPEKRTWLSGLNRSILENLGQQLDGFKQDPSYLSKLARLTDEQMSKDVRNIFIECSEAKNPRVCYKERLESAADEIGNAQGINPGQNIFDARQIVSTLYSYDSQAELAGSFYHNLLETSADLIKSESKNLWDSCQALGSDDEQQPTGRKFTVSDGYLVSSLYNCVNNGFDELEEKILSQMQFKGEHVSLSSEKSFLKKDLEKRISKALTAEFLKLKESELKAAKEFMDGETQSPAIRAKILANLDWVGMDHIQADCRKEAMKSIPFEPQAHLKTELFKPVLQNKICNNIAAAPEFTQWMIANNSQLRAEVLNILEGKILEEAKNLKRDCENRLSSSRILGFFGMSPQQRCLNEGWDAIEDAAALETSKLDIAFRLNLTYDALRLEGKIKRPQIKKQISR